VPLAKYAAKATTWSLPSLQKEQNSQSLLWIKARMSFPTFIFFFPVEVFQEYFPVEATHLYDDIYQVIRKTVKTATIIFVHNLLRLFFMAPYIASCSWSSCLCI
jgi:hypothetical protein